MNVNDSGFPTNESTTQIETVEVPALLDDVVNELVDHDEDPLEVTLPRFRKRTSKACDFDEPPHKNSTKSLPKIKEFGNHATWERFAAWKKWKTLLLYSLSFAENWSDDMKIAQTLLSGGEELRDIVLTYKLAPEQGTDDALKKFFDNIERHFGELIDKSAAYAKVTQCRQTPGESTDKYYRRLRTAADVANVDDELVRAHFVANMGDKSIARQAEIEDWDVQKIIKTASRVESAKGSGIDENPLRVAAVEARRTSNYSRDNRTSVRGRGGNHVNHQRDASGNQCQQCGYFGHRSGTCPAVGKRCLQCNVVGHFKKCCRAGKSINAVQNQPSQVNDDWD